MNTFSKWGLVYSPDVDAGSDAGSDQGGAPPVGGQEQARPVPINERPVDGPGSGRSQIRRQLEDSIKKARDVDPDTGRETPQRGKGGKPTTGYQSRANEMRADGNEGEPAAPADQDQPPVEPKEAVPEAYGRELRASWAQVPEAWRQAIIKREQDAANGVAQLQQRYAELDQVLAPRAEVIKKHGHTPAQAVNQLFAWFDALGQDPDRVRQGQPPIAFIHLAKSFGLDKLIEEAMKSQQGQGTQPAQDAGQPAGDIPPAVQQYITNLEGKLAQSMQLISQKFGTLEQQQTMSQQEKTNEILAHWSQGKEHFNDVKMMMAHLLESGAVPPLEGNRADLDKAYEMAVYAIPEVRAKVLAAAEAKRIADAKAKKDAETAAQQKEADRARRAAGGLAPGAPGEGGPMSQRPGDRRKGKSVRESLNDAINELSS